MTLTSCSRRSEIDSFIVMDIMRAAHEREAAGTDIVHMEVGQPGTPAPRTAREAAKAAIDGDLLGYTDAMGRPSLRGRIARHYGDWYNLDIDPARIAVTTGSSAGFVLAFLACFDEGATVGLPSPGYPCYRHICNALGVTPVILTTGANTRWMPTPQMIAAGAGGKPLDGLLLASPANPTGTMLEPDRLMALADACRESGTRFISDEIYHGLTWDQPGETVLSHTPDAIVINSFSKYFSMTGWRIGWMVLPDNLVRPVERLMQNLYINAPTISQVAAEAAFDGTEELEGHKQVYAKNREHLMTALPKMGITSLVPPDGAFYIYADVSHLTGDAHDLAKRLLEEAGIATTPGTDFDEARGAGYLRLSYARSEADILRGIERLGEWLEGR
ncbi:MAG: pyridoxal phosphate-dependent aminotransferase [Hyphomicrobiaceae bacterium]